MKFIFTKEPSEEGGKKKQRIPSELMVLSNTAQSHHENEKLYYLA